MKYTTNIDRLFIEEDDYEMKVIAPKCPNCGAPVSVGTTTKCQYCGAILIFKNDALALKSLSACHECGASIGAGSFICINCGKLLTTDPKELDIVKTFQKRIRFMHNRLVNSLFNVVRERLEPQEYMYHVSGAKGGFLKGKDRQTVVTNKRIIRYHDGKFNDLSYENIVTVSSPIALTVPDWDLGSRLTGLYSVIITTYEGDISFLFSDLPSAEDFSIQVNLAHNNFTLKKKEINALLCYIDI